MALSTSARTVVRPASPSKPPLLLDAQLQQQAEAIALPRFQSTGRIDAMPRIDAMRGYYLVRLAGETQARHLVRKDRTCVEHGAGCPAVEAVAVYLKPAVSAPKTSRPTS